MKNLKTLKILTIKPHNLNVFKVITLEENYCSVELSNKNLVKVNYTKNIEVLQQW